MNGPNQLRGVNNFHTHCFQLQGRSCAECNDGDEGDSAVSKEFFQRFKMTVILSDRIVQLFLALVDDLRPILRLLASHDPARVVLRFDDEYAISGYNQMIDLSRLSVGLLNHDIVEYKILLGIKLLQLAPYRSLTDLTL